MQRVYAYLDTGGGLQPINSNTSDIAMLADLTIQWGTDSPDTQPDPAVADFTLRDQDGDLAGDFIRLAGARFMLGVNRQPTWDTLGDQFGSWDECAFAWRNMPGLWEPPSGAATHTIFDGIVSTGGTITRSPDGYWLIRLTATSRMVMWKRLARKGPTSTDKRLKDMHWTGTPSARLTELNNRARTAGAPQADTTGLTQPPSVAPYDKDDYPTQLDLLHRLYAHSSLRPIWHEDTRCATTTIGHTDLANPVGIILDAAASAWTRDTDGNLRPALPSGEVETDEDHTMTILEPWTQATIQGKAASLDDDGTLTLDDSETTYSASSLPKQLTDAQKTVTLDSDAILSSTVSDIKAFTPSSQDRQRMDTWITTMDTMLVPSTVVFDSRRQDAYLLPWLYQCQPSGPFYVAGQLTDGLTHADGTPTVSGAWTTIGGTLTFQWVNGVPVIRNECHLMPLPATTSDPLAWADLADWPPAWQDVPLTWAQMSQVNETLSTIPTTESA